MLQSLAKACALSAMEVGGHVTLALLADSKHMLGWVPFGQSTPLKCAVSQTLRCKDSLSASASTISPWYLQRLPGKSSLPKAASDWSKLQQVKCNVGFVVSGASQAGQHHNQCVLFKRKCLLCLTRDFLTEQWCRTRTVLVRCRHALRNKHNAGHCCLLTHQNILNPFNLSMKAYPGSFLRLGLTVSTQ